MRVIKSLISCAAFVAAMVFAISDEDIQWRVISLTFAWVAVYAEDHDRH